MASTTDTQESSQPDSDEGDNSFVTTVTAIATEIRDSAIGTAFGRLISAITGSFLYFMITAGVVMAVLGATPLFDGAEAGLLGIVGVSAILYGLIGIAALRLIGYSG